MNLRLLLILVLCMTFVSRSMAQAERPVTASGDTVAVHAEANKKHAPFSVASIIAHNMVLQQRSNVPLWGTGIAGAPITITASWGKKAAAVVGPDGAWMAKLATPKAGGPFTVTIKATDTTVVLKNVLVGEVWLASGQSNMEMPLAGWPPSDTIAHSASEIQGSKGRKIRMFTVAHGLAVSPETSASGEWIAASPETAGKFSATAYFFAKALQTALKVPIGIIHSSWGGTQIQPWISAETISKLDKYKPMMEKLALGKPGLEKYAAWLRSFPAIDMSKRSGDDKWKDLNFNDGRCPLPSYADSQWKEMTLPQNWESSEMGSFDGAVWFRKTVDVPASWIKKSMTIDLGPIDDMDQTFVNGVKVGGMETEGMWNMPRVYQVPDSIITSTTVSIAVRVVDNQGGGGLFGAPDQMALRLAGTNETLPLAGAWKYLPVASFDGKSFAVFGEEGRKYYSQTGFGTAITNTTPTAIYNAMIAPLVPYAIKGAIWYQGESNVAIAGEYATLLPALMTDWRSKFDRGDFPFYYVQIAPYAYGAGSHSELLREAQLLALSAKNTGMAVTLDIGSARTIHPWNKKDVGARLAALALAKDYGRKIPYSGPVYSSMKKDDGRIVLSFASAGKGLVLKGNGSEFQIAGDDKEFKPATVEVRGTTLVVSHPGIQDPAAVRYAFTDTSKGVLFNTDGLPASSFRTDSWK